MKRLAGVLLIVSAICFGLGMTRPVIIDYFSTDNSVAKRLLIQENPDQWQFANTMMDMGVIIAPIGVVILTFALWRSNKDNKLVLLAIASAISLSLAVTVWMSDYWPFPRLTVLMTFGIVLLGLIIILRYSKWGGTLTIAVELITVIVLYIIFQDVPPGAHFLPLLIAGISLVVGGAGNRLNDARLTSNY